MKVFLSVLLLILKILGITVASVLGLVILVLCLVLFVPIRYKGAGFYKDGEYDFEAKVSYLLHIVSVSFDLKREKQLIIKIFGFELKKKEKKPAKAKKQRKKKDKKNQKEISDQASEYTENSCVEEEKEVLSEAKEEINTGESVLTEQPAETDGGQNGEKVKKKKEKKKKEKKKKTSTKESFYDKIKEIKEKIQSEEFKESFALIKEKLFVLLKAILPKKWRVEGKVGFEDPAMNGKVCAVLGILYPIIHDHVYVGCDFEETVIDVNGYFKGRIFVITLVVTGLKIYFNKSIRKTFGL